MVPIVEAVVQELFKVRSLFKKSAFKLIRQLYMNEVHTQKKELTVSTLVLF